MNTVANDNRKHEAFLRYGLICEMYFGKSMQIKEIATELNCNVVTVSTAISRYLETPIYPIALCSKINDNKSYIKSVWQEQTNVQIAESLNTNEKKIALIAKNMGLPPKQTCRARTPNYKKRETNLIVNQQTGVFYVNISEAAKAHGIGVATLNEYFKGKGTGKQCRYLCKLN